VSGQAVFMLAQPGGGGCERLDAARFVSGVICYKYVKFVLL